MIQQSGLGLDQALPSKAHGRGKEVALISFQDPVTRIQTQATSTLTSSLHSLFPQGPGGHSPSLKEMTDKRALSMVMVALWVSRVAPRLQQEVDTQLYRLLGTSNMRVRCVNGNEGGTLSEGPDIKPVSRF